MPSINSNTGAMFSVNAARKTDQDMSTAMKRLSTGDRITNAGDDAAGAAISDRMTANIKGIEQSIRNAGDVISMAQVSEGALGEILNESTGIKKFDIKSTIIDARLVKKVPKNIAVHNKLIPITYTADSITVGMVDVLFPLS